MSLLRRLALLFTFLLLAACTTACSLVSAVTNPGAAWALQEPATMSVVLRRATAAERTSQHIDRLLVATSAKPEDKWPEEVALSPEEAKALLETTGKRFPYEKMPFRIMVAEAWARHLSTLQGPKLGGGKGGLGKVKGADGDKKDGKKPDAKKGDDKKKGKDAKGDKDPKKDAKGDKDAKKDGKDKDAKKDGKDKDGKDGKGDKDGKGEEPAEDEGPPLPEDNLLAAIDGELAASYGKIAQKRASIAKLEKELAAEEAARDKMTGDADRKASEEKSKGIEEAIEKAEAEVEPLENAFLEHAAEQAKKADAKVRDRLTPALVGMRQAVRDAEAAAAAATLRYPLAVPGVKDDVQSAIPNFVADIIEEQTGHRPELSGLKPDVRMEGTDVELTLNGLSKSDLGKIQMSDLLSETTSRTKEYLERTLTLLGITGSAADHLAYQGKMLDAILKGFGTAGTKVPEPAKIEDLTPSGAATVQASVQTK